MERKRRAKALRFLVCVIAVAILLIYIAPKAC